MSKTYNRLKELWHEHLDLGRDPDPNISFRDSGLSSVDAVAFMREVNRDFELSLSTDDCDKFSTLGELAQLIEARRAG